MELSSQTYLPQDVDFTQEVGSRLVSIDSLPLAKPQEVKNLAILHAPPHSIHEPQLRHLSVRSYIFNMSGISALARQALGTDNQLSEMKRHYSTSPDTSRKHPKTSNVRESKYSSVSRLIFFSPLTIYLMPIHQRSEDTKEELSTIIKIAKV
jgi:hypothetical protein